MAKRLTETYPINSQVEIFFEQRNTWVQGTVIKYESPGIWVKTTDNQLWFVTNTRHIRLLASY